MAYEKTVLDELSYRDVPAIIVGVALPDSTPFGDEPLEELASLCGTAGLRVRGEIHQNRKDIDTAYFVGKGKAGEIAEAVKESGAKIVVFDNELKPSQQMNLEEVCNCSVIDRTELILAIFAQHARTRQATVQVELARAEYALPRLKNLWSHLERQRGALSAVGGAGERQIELDRRMLRKRISRLKDELDEIIKRREIEVARRSDLFQVAIVGYTNAGKSTLMNALTQEGVLAEDKLFATLDTRSRILKVGWAGYGDRDVVITDTVGFIRDLPKDLFAAFRATFEEAADADLLLHVVDASDPGKDDHIDTTLEVLEDLKLLEIPRVLVWNKSDLTAPGAGNQLVLTHPGSVLVSATHRETLRALLERIASELAERWIEAAKTPSVADLSAVVAPDPSSPALVDPDEATTLDQMLAAAGKRVRRRVQPIH